MKSEKITIRVTTQFGTVTTVKEQEGFYIATNPHHGVQTFGKTRSQALQSATRQLKTINQFQGGTR